MWGSRDNIYYNPERCGVEIVAQVEADISWEFDITLLLKHEGRFYMVQDEGCSCPTPFEDVESVADLTPVRDMRDVDTFLREHERWYSVGDVLSFKNKAREVLS